MKKLRRNYNARTPKRWKLISQFVGGLCISISGAITQAPMPEKYKTWIVLILGVLAYGFDLAIKVFTNDEDYAMPSDNSKANPDIDTTS